jgi:hypothetical protein
MRRHLAVISASGLFSRLRKALITREWWQLDENCLQNTNSKPDSAYRVVKLLLQCSATLRRFRFRSVPRLHKALITRERLELYEKCSQKTSNKLGSGFRMIKPLPLAGATCHWFHLPVRSRDLKKRW